MRRVRTVAGIALLVIGVMLGAFGLVAVLYDGDCRGGDCSGVYGTLLGSRLDANAMGAVALVLAVAATLVAGRLLKRSAAKHPRAP